MIAGLPGKETLLPAYADGFALLADELTRLDLLLRLALRRRPCPDRPWSLAAPPGLVISAEEVETLLRPESEKGSDPAGPEPLRHELAALDRTIAEKTAAARRQGISLPLVELAVLFGLSALELRMVIICLAPELDRRYDTIYTFLQDDITRKKPSVALILDLLAENRRERWGLRHLLTPGGRLRRSTILTGAVDPHSPSGTSDLAEFLRVDPRIVAFLLGDNALDGRLAGLCRRVGPAISPIAVPVAPDISRRLSRLARSVPGHGETTGKTIVVLHGPAGSGKMHLARSFCREIGCPLLVVDALLLPADPDERQHRLHLAFREGLLTRAIVYLDRIDALLGADEGERMFRAIEQATLIWGWIVFVSAEQPWQPRAGDGSITLHTIEMPPSTVPQREACWQHALQECGGSGGQQWSALLARRFQLTPGAIMDAARRAMALAGGANRPPGLDDFAAACRDGAHHRLASLAVKGTCRCGWTDLVLPPDRIALLAEICNQVRHGHTVFNEWGFARRISRGRGLSVLFTGPPGTGKSLAAEVIAGELGLDLYKIDLAGVVSKYIGETEKNLNRIFREAEQSNAILFFDEADALFGKRTEVKDAHDRYANIETSYLLQKMEEYEGMVILATNLRANMDEAFTRRIRFIVDFPFPDSPLRQRIWQGHLPAEAPLADDIDCAALAERLPVTGGTIRNIALNSAFLAARENGPLTMGHILHAAKREYAKIGKLWTDGENKKEKGA
ncbi:MAG: AAA family ATPase [Thermodesulfobacteriota bacterium]